MKLWVKILIFSLLGILVIGVIVGIYFLLFTPNWLLHYDNAQGDRSAEDTENSSDTDTSDATAKINADSYNLIGLMYDSGIEALDNDSLPNADYQVTFLSKNDTGLNVDGFYLLASSGESTFWGKCVGVAGTVENAWKSTTKIQNSYNRSAIMVENIDVLPFEECRSGYTKSTPESIYTNAGKTKEILVGTITHTKRPSPDIFYDYKITIPGGYIDKYSASGLNQKVSSMVVAPANYDVLVDMEDSMTESVTIEAYISQGYAETNYFDIYKLTAN